MHSLRMDRLLLVISTFCFLFGFAYTMHALGARVYKPSRLNFFAILTGFLFQTGFLYLRGQMVGRCPLTSLFEVVIFLAWSMVLFYLLIGPTYRISLLGAFTSPLVFVLQVGGLLLLKDNPVRTHSPPESVAGDARGAFYRGLWRLRAGERGGRHVSGPGAAVEDASHPLDLLSAAFDPRSRRGKPSPHHHRFCAADRWTGRRVRDGKFLGAFRPHALVHRSVVALRIHSRSRAAASHQPPPRGMAFRDRLQRNPGLAWAA